jgi:hypothetical protein
MQAAAVPAMSSSWQIKNVSPAPTRPYPGPFENTRHPALGDPPSGARRARAEGEQRKGCQYLHRREHVDTSLVAQYTFTVITSFIFRQNNPQ